MNNDQTITSFVVVEYDHIRSIQPKNVTKFDNSSDACELINKLLNEFRVCELIDGSEYGEFGKVIGAPCPSPYNLADKKCVRLWDNKDPSWREFKGRY